MVALGLAACGSSGAAGRHDHDPSVTRPRRRLAIKHAYEVLFDLADPALSPKLAVVQDGSALESAMKTALKSALAKSAAGATLSKVTIEHGTACKNEFLPSPCATVTYDILSPAKTVVLANAAGVAVYQHGQWLVGKTTICTLLELENSGSRAARMLKPRSRLPEPWQQFAGQVAELVDGPGLDDLAFAQDHQLLGQLERSGQLLFDDEKRGARVADLPQRPVDVVHHPRGEPERELVDDEQLRRHGEDTGKREHALLASRERARELASPVGEPSESARRRARALRLCPCGRGRG